MRRRRFLAAVGAATTATLAGCSGRLPGTEPRTLDTEVHESSANELSWDFPAQSSDEDHAGIGYVEIGREPRFDTGSPILTAGFHFNATITPYSNYKLDRFTARFSAPTNYYQRHGSVTYLVEPPGQWDDFRVHYQLYPTRREFVVEMRDIGIAATIQFPFVIRALDTFPSALRCAFSLQASESGVFGETVHVSDAGTFDFDTGDENS